jgi:hypothetical protein
MHKDKFVYEVRINGVLWKVFRDKRKAEMRLFRYLMKAYEELFLTSNISFSITEIRK